MQNLLMNKQACLTFLCTYSMFQECGIKNSILVPHNFDSILASNDEMMKKLSCFLAIYKFDNKKEIEIL